MYAMLLVKANLGEEHIMLRYDDKLKLWIEEVTEPLAEEAVFPPLSQMQLSKIGCPIVISKDVPETETFHANSEPEYKSHISYEPNSGIPPTPPSSNQFTACRGMGV